MLSQLVSNFQDSSNTGLGRKVVIMLSAKKPPCFKYVATLPWEMLDLFLTHGGHWPNFYATLYVQV